MLKSWQRICHSKDDKRREDTVSVNKVVALHHQWQREGSSSHDALDSIADYASSLHSPCSGSEQLLRKGSSAAQLNLESVFLCKEFQGIQPKKLQMIGN